MDTIPERFRTVAAAFTERVRDVPSDRWHAPAPCEGWEAIDVVRHLVEWVPGFFGHFTGIALEPGPPVDDDPLGAWLALDGALQRRLDDPAVAGLVFDDLPMGRMTFEEAVATFVLTDVLAHTWDLARATGLDEALDPDEVHRWFDGMLEMDDTAMRESGQFGPRTPVGDDADEQTQLLAFLGRRP